MSRQDEDVVNQRLEANRKLPIHTSLVEGREFVVMPTVFSPEVNSSTSWASSVVPVDVAPLYPGGSFLEVGTGCGAISVLVALAGCPDVTSIDINPNAVESCRRNAEQHNVKVNVFLSDIFDAIPEGKTFDVIFWNFPFNFPTKAESVANYDFCAQSLYDPGYKLLGRYLEEAREYLKPEGRLFITFSPDTGNLERFDELTKLHRWVPILHACKECEALNGSQARFHLYRLQDEDAWKDKEGTPPENSSILGS